MNRLYILLAFIFTLSLLCLPQDLWAQSELLNEINQQRIRLNKGNMYVLGAWAVGNIGVSGYLRSRTTGNVRYFHEMNAIWNFVNLGLAAGGLYGSFVEDPSTYTAWETYRAQQNIEKILLFNMALNFTYMTAGGYLIERSKRANDRPERLEGYGQSLIMQGGFLFVFDLTQYLLHHYGNQGRLKQLLDTIQVSPEGIGMTVTF
ncbi:MAG: hypothetical protein AAF135_13060 [Bacteroidota bacterium]